MNETAKIETDVKVPCVSFKLPSLPPSMNKLYNFLPYGKNRIVLSREAQQYKSQMKLFVPKFEVADGEHLGISIEVHTNWICKNGSIKKADVHNLLKIITDLISEKQGYDDASFFKWKAIKIQDVEEFVYATVYKL